MQSQVNGEGEGDSRMFNFYRHSPAQRGVDTVSRVDSKGHLCGALLLTRSLARVRTLSTYHWERRFHLAGGCLEVSRTLNVLQCAAGLIFKSKSGQDLMHVPLASGDVF